MRTQLTVIAAGALLGTAAVAAAQENSLVGIRLYDSGVRVVSIYGSPNEVQAVSIGGGAVGPSGGGGRGGGLGPSGGGGGQQGPLGNQGASAASSMHGPFSFGDDLLRLQGRANAGGGGGLAIDSDGAGPAGGGPGGAPPGGGGGSQGSRVLFTRWVYNRGGSKYGFILDRFNRVVQIEAIGIQNNKVRTRKGIGFGSTFSQIIKKYTAPDGYEIAGDNLVVRYLTRSKVAFRLSRLGANRPHVVTGIVVSAGKA